MTVKPMASVGIATFFKITNNKVLKNEIKMAKHNKIEIKKSKQGTWYCQIKKQVACSQTRLVILTEVACSQTRLVKLTYIALFYGGEQSYSLHTS